MAAAGHTATVNSFSALATKYGLKVYHVRVMPFICLEKHGRQEALAIASAACESHDAAKLLHDGLSNSQSATAADASAGSGEQWLSAASKFVEKAKAVETHHLSALEAEVKALEGHSAAPESFVTAGASVDMSHPMSHPSRRRELNEDLFAMGFVDRKFLDEAQENEDMISLFEATTDGDLDQVQMLVEDGVAVDADHWHGKTLLICAAENGHVDVVEYLVGRGEDMEAQDFNMMTALIWASRNGHVDVVDYLVGHGADMEAKDECWDRPMHLAAKKGHVDVVECLVGHGADMAAKSGYARGKTPYELAVSKHKTAVVAFLNSVTAMGGSAAYRVYCIWKRRSSLVKWRMAFVGPL